MVYSRNYRKLWQAAAGAVLAGLLVLGGCVDAAPVGPAESTTPATAEKPADFVVGDLLIMPESVKIRDTVSISVPVTNQGAVAGSYEAVLKINDEAVNSKEIKLAGGESGVVSFKASQETPGNYVVEVGGSVGTFVVIPPPSLPDEPLPQDKPKESPPEPTAPGPPGRPLEEATPEEHSDWTISTGSGTNLRAVHMGGNWGTNRTLINTLPEEYFSYLRDINVEWVGVSVSLHVDGSMDGTVELDYDEHLFTPTFKDDALRQLISTFRSHGFEVYIHVAIDSGTNSEYPVERWQIGDPNMYLEDPSISADAWPWRTDHPQHQSFVAEFWQTHTDSLVHIARIAEEEGAGMLTLGTEMNRLYRSRSGGVWPNDFLDEMREMVSAVREVYSGQLGYEMHYGALLDRELFGPGSDYIHDDLDLDFIGVSVYLPLMESVPDRVPTIGELEAIWDSIFNQHLIPLQQRNGNRPIVFTEFGYTDSMLALLQGDNDSFVDKVFTDKDGNGKDDGEEVQANIYAALFNTMERYPGVVSGAFLWDVMMDTEDGYQAGFAKLRSTNIRGKLVEDVVREQYAGWR